jgi:hypothetical protein
MLYLLPLKEQNRYTAVKRNLLISVVVVVAVFATWTVVRRFIPSYIEYRGQRIKLTKYYLTYEDYKDDPENIHPSEVARVQRLVVEAPISSSFSSRKAMVDAAFDIHFPGYGVGGLSDGTKDGENSLSGVSIEIPLADKDRYFVFRHANGKYVLVDSFVDSNVPLIMRVKQDGNQLVYSTYEGTVKVVRPMIPQTN